MVRNIKMLVICFGWLSGLAASLCAIWMFLFGIRVMFSESVNLGLQFVGASFVLGWVLGFYKRFIESAWASDLINHLILVDGREQGTLHGVLDQQRERPYGRSQDQNLSGAASRSTNHLPNRSDNSPGDLKELPRSPTGVGTYFQQTRPDSAEMERYGIAFDGKQYTFGPHRYDRYRDALSYAQKLEAEKGQVASPAWVDMVFGSGYKR